MNSSVEETGPVERRLRVEVQAATVDAAFEKAYRTIGREARVPGFRPGKAPRSVIERQFAPQARAEVFEHLVRDSLFEAIDQAKLDVVSEPRLEPGEDPRQGSPFVYQALLEIRPTVVIQKIRGIDVKRPVLPEPPEDPVERYLEQMRQSQAQLVDEPEGTRSAVGHVAIVDFVGRVDGVPFPGGSAEGAQFEIGSGSTIPGFEEGLTGLAVGEERTFPVAFPADYHEASLAGLPAEFHAKLVALKRKELPALDDEFAKDISDQDSLEALRTDLRARLEEQRKTELERLEREAVLVAIVEANPFPVPPSFVDRELAFRIQQAVRGLGRMPEERLRPAIEMWREQWRPQAEQAVRLALLVPEIAAAEKLEATEAEIDARIVELAEQHDRPKEELEKSLRESGAIENLRMTVLEQKIVDLVRASAQMVDA